MLKAEKWIGVPMATNVYTMPGYFYIDYGVLGIIVCAFIYGVVFGRIYSSIKFKHNIGGVIFYSLYLYCIIFQFFGDWFLTFFSSTLQSIFWIFLFTHSFKLNSNRTLRC